MKGYLGIVAHLDALPAMLGTAPRWNSTLALGVLAVVAASTYVLIGFSIADELQDA